MSRSVLAQSRKRTPQRLALPEQASKPSSASWASSSSRQAPPLSITKSFSQSFVSVMAHVTGTAPVDDGHRYQGGLKYVAPILADKGASSAPLVDASKAGVLPQNTSAFSQPPASSGHSQQGALDNKLAGPIAQVGASHDASKPGANGFSGLLSASQVIHAINQNLPLPVANFPEFVNQVLQTRQFTAGIKQSIEVSLAPKHLGALTAQFALTNQNQMVITVYTQSLITAKALDAYKQEIQQIVGKTEFSMGNLTIKQGIPPVRGSQLSGQQTGQQDFLSKYTAKRGRHNRRRKQDDDMTIDVTV